MAGPPPLVLLLPAFADPRGFLLRTVTRLLRPRILSTTRRSATLCSLPALGFPPRFGFLAPPSRLRRQSRRASLGKAHRLPTSRPAAHRGATPDIWPRSFKPARPAPRCHVAGSLFATYAGSTSCFLPTRRLCSCSCPVGVALPSGHGGQFYFRHHAPEGQRLRHAKRTSGPWRRPRMADAYGGPPRGGGIFSPSEPSAAWSLGAVGRARACEFSVAQDHAKSIYSAMRQVARKRGAAKIRSTADRACHTDAASWKQ